LDLFTTSKSDDMEVESSGGNGDLAAASVAACRARASGVQVAPVITAAAPMTALRMMKARRLMFDGIADSAGKAGKSGSLSAAFVAFISYKCFGFSGYLGCLLQILLLI
jgi:hypothetical protein